MAFPLAAVGFQNSVFFGVYGNTIRWLSQEADGSGPKAPSYGAIFVAGSFAGAIQAFVASPIDLVKVKLQSQTGIQVFLSFPPRYAMTVIDIVECNRICFLPWGLCLLNLLLLLGSYHGCQVP